MVHKIIHHIIIDHLYTYFSVLGFDSHNLQPWTIHSGDFPEVCKFENVSTAERTTG